MGAKDDQTLGNSKLSQSIVRAASRLEQRSKFKKYAQRKLSMCSYFVNRRNEKKKHKTKCKIKSIAAKLMYAPS